jgi:hypothetical protein
VNVTLVFTVPVPGSGWGSTLRTVTNDQLSSPPLQVVVTSTRRSPGFTPVTFPARRTEAGLLELVTGSAGLGGNVAATSDGPGKLLALDTSNVWAGTPGVAVLAICMPAGMTRGSDGRVVVRIAATCPVAARPGAGA